ncbi:dihydrodipicolinate synthase family protein [Rhodococcoides kyotonense]|uniref:4-hydroxy-tetrahydrodipicolinate synthase n=1 Tax=Rhodococcoides kyotonense TaxID=398843 RepID=A0A239MJ16_9NOCA|nr:dihydrodipicolinate synthase family protein [Rhodococcus kyotonensis]SNT42253.1 4-hydroxy-tetrahydrodipicolinate synthase [Rhodococcus kyotonensis]
MNRDDVAWSGYWPAAPTPFTATGALDTDALGSLMNLYADMRVDGVLINGSTGEWFSQSDSERRTATEVAVDAVAGRFPVVIGVSAYTPAESSSLAKHAESAGADGILATPPPYVHPSPDEIVSYYESVVSATSLPFMVYNWPRGVAVDMGSTPGLFSRLADIDNVVAIKDSTGDWLKMLDTVEAVSERVRVFGSFLHRRGLATLLDLGGDGNIDGGGVGAPFAVPFYRAVAERDVDAARMWADKYRAYSSRLINGDYSGVYASPIPQLKAVMNLLGQPGGHVRSPLLPVTDASTLAALQAVVDESGIAEASAQLVGVGNAR